MYGAEDPSIAGMVLDSPFSDLVDLMMELVDTYKIRLPKFTVSKFTQMKLLDTHILRHRLIFVRNPILYLVWGKCKEFSYKKNMKTEKFVKKLDVRILRCKYTVKFSKSEFSEIGKCTTKFRKIINK